MSRWTSAPAVADIGPGAAPEASAMPGRADLAAVNGKSRRVARKSIAPGTVNGVGGHKPVMSGVGEISVFRDEVQAYWRAQNPGTKVFPWGPPDERALAALVASSSGLDLEGFRLLLRNRGASEVMSSALPRRWLRSLMEFAGGPLDRAHKAARGARSL